VAYLQKPVAAEDLLAAITMALGKRPGAETVDARRDLLAVTKRASSFAGG